VDIQIQQDVASLAESLPPVVEFKRRSEPDYYGASFLIAEKLGLEKPPHSFATWCHGWHFDPVTHPRQVVNVVGEKRQHLVALQKHADLLAQNGFPRSAAVGMPFLYADPVQCQRIPGSLLVMPAHCVNDGQPDWNEESYAATIDALRPRFSTVVACLQANCVKYGHWVNALDKRNIPWIVGASSADINALKRMRTILGSFEFMTTNCIGTHVAYASYVGCRVSIHGRFVQQSYQQLAKNPFYQQHPEVLTLNIQRSCEAEVRRNYPQFFTEPHLATTQQAWAAQVMGAAHCRAPAEIAELLGWNSGAQTWGSVVRAGRYSKRRALKIADSVRKRLPKFRRAA
jgi:hypothetical protein